MPTRIKAGFAASVIGAPKDFEYMPAGRHRLHASVDGKPAVIEVEISPEDAERLNDTLQASLAAAESGAASRPFIDFDHEGGRAAAIPVRFFWADGIRLEVEWTKAGRDSIEGREYSYFSPEFYADKKTGRLSGIPEYGPIGGLVNTPAFQTIERIAAQYPKNGDKPTMDEKDELLKERTKKVEELTAEVAKLTAKLSELQTSNEELVKAKAEIEKERDGIKSERDALDAKVEASRKEKIETQVATLVDAGRLKKESKDTIVKAALAQEDDGAAIFAALPEAPKGKGHPPIPTNHAKKVEGDDEPKGIARIEASIAKAIKKEAN